MARTRRLSGALIAATMLAGCVAAPSSSPPATTSPSRVPSATAVPIVALPSDQPALGEALPVVERPAPATCDRLQRHDTLAARNTRDSVDFGGIGIDASDSAIAAAAADPGADIELIGIPLRSEEVAQLRRFGMHIDKQSPMAFWVHEGRPDLFGGIWIDPPGSDRLIVSIVDGDAEAVRLARCLERPGLDVSYVMATHSVEELQALQERINAEWGSLEAKGIAIVSTGQDSIANRVSVEIQELTPDEARELTARYGDGIALASIPAPTPYVPLTLPEVPFAMGTDWLFNAAGNDGRQGEQGTWELLAGRVAGGKLRLRVSIQPPAHGLPVRSGPAVLFAGMEAYGGSGDVGMGEPMDALATVALPACDDTDCRYEAEIVLPTAEIMPAVRRLEDIGEILWVTVNLTLVRTFGDGTWLQVLPLDAGEGGGLAGMAGRLGAAEPVRGRIFPFGLFPADQARVLPKGSGMFTTSFDYARAVERRRVRLDDTSRALPMVAGTLHVEIEPACQNAAHLTLHTATGDHVFDVDVYRKRALDATFAIPTGTDWFLTLHDGGGIDFDQGRQGWGVRIGTIRSDGEPIKVDARFSCVGLTGSLDVAVQR